jgi:hypothetical protein
MAELAVLPPHSDGAAYLEELGKRERGASIFAAGADLAGKLDALALRNLEPGIDPWQRKLNVEDARGKVKSAAGKVAELEKAADGKKVAAATAPGSADAKPVPPRESKLWQDNAEGLLFEAQSAPRGSLLKDKKVDLLVYGSVEAIGDYVSVVVRGYDAALDRDVFTWQDYASPSDPSPLAGDMADRIASYIAGRAYARIDLEVEPPSAELMVDGRKLASGERRIYSFGTPSVTVDASAPDRSSCEIAIEVKEGDRKKISFELPPFSTGVARISTLPGGLTVFLDGLPLGASPVEATIPGRRSVASAFIESEGKVQSSASVIVPASGKAELAIRPSSEDKDLGKRVEKAKDDFYWALGWFMLALPPTTICRGLNSIYYNACEAGGTAELLKAYNDSSTALAILGTVTGGLAINAIVRLVGYISAAH